ncbi:MAG: hypothetical protein ABW139_14485 [Candidatus Thiodiazotropha sp. DIVDIV]
MEAVYLLKYSTWGHHSLGFYEGGQFTEYTYGDWQLFALNQRDTWTAWKNMTFASQGALGRKSVELESGDPLCENFVGCEAVVLFDAPEDKVLALKELLKKDYLNGIESEIYNKKEELFFVKHQDPYWGFHNCNHELVEWLEALGAVVSGRVFYNPGLIEGMKPQQNTITHLP